MSHNKKKSKNNNNNVSKNDGELSNQVERLLIFHEGMSELCGGVDEGASMEELTQHVLYYYDAKHPDTCNIYMDDVDDDQSLLSSHYMNNNNPQHQQSKLLQSRIMDQSFSSSFSFDNTFNSDNDHLSSNINKNNRTSTRTKTATIASSIHYAREDIVHFCGLCAALFSFPTVLQQEQQQQDNQNNKRDSNKSQQQQNGTTEVHFANTSLYFCPLESTAGYNHKVFAVLQMPNADPLAVQTSIQRCHDLFCLLRGGGIVYRLSDPSHLPPSPSVKDDNLDISTSSYARRRLSSRRLSRQFSSTSSRRGSSSNHTKGQRRDSQLSSRHSLKYRYPNDASSSSEDDDDDDMPPDMSDVHDVNKATVPLHKQSSVLTEHSHNTPISNPSQEIPQNGIDELNSLPNPWSIQHDGCIYPGMKLLYKFRKAERKQCLSIDKLSNFLELKRANMIQQLETLQSKIRELLHILPLTSLRRELKSHYDEYITIQNYIASTSPTTITATQENHYAKPNAPSFTPVTNHYANRCLVEALPPPVGRRQLFPTLENADNSDPSVNVDDDNDDEESNIQNLLKTHRSTPSVVASARLGRALREILEWGVDNYRQDEPLILGVSSFYHGHFLYTHLISKFPFVTESLLLGLQVSNKSACAILHYMTSFQEKMRQYPHMMHVSVTPQQHHRLSILSSRRGSASMASYPERLKTSAQQQQQQPLAKQASNLVEGGFPGGAQWNDRSAAGGVSTTFGGSSVISGLMNGRNVQEKISASFLSSPPLSMLNIVDKICDVNDPVVGNVWTPVFHLPIDRQVKRQQDFLNSSTSATASVVQPQPAQKQQQQHSRKNQRQLDRKTQDTHQQDDKKEQEDEVEGSDFIEVNVALFTAGSYSFLIYFDPGELEFDDDISQELESLIQHETLNYYMSESTSSIHLSDLRSKSNHGDAKGIVSKNTTITTDGSSSSNYDDQEKRTRLAILLEQIAKSLFACIRDTSDREDACLANTEKFVLDEGLDVIYVDRNIDKVVIYPNPLRRRQLAGTDDSRNKKDGFQSYFRGIKGLGGGGNGKHTSNNNNNFNARKMDNATTDHDAFFMAGDFYQASSHVDIRHQLASLLPSDLIYALDDVMNELHQEAAKKKRDDTDDDDDDDDDSFPRRRRPASYGPTEVCFYLEDGWIWGGTGGHHRDGCELYIILDPKHYATVSDIEFAVDKLRRLFFQTPR